MGLCLSSAPSVPPVPSLASCSSDNTPRFTLEGQSHPAKILRVIDGDTVDMAFSLMGHLFQFRVRLYGIDTPEKRPSKSNPLREEEKKKAFHATEALKQYLLGLDGLVTAQFHEADKYGRWLCELYHPLTQENINQWMIDQGHAVSYFGGTKNQVKTEGA